MPFIRLSIGKTKNRITLIVATLLISGFLSMTLQPVRAFCSTLEQSFDEMKSRYPEYLSRMKANGAEEQQILAFVRDLDNILSEKTLTESNFSDQVLDAVWSLKDEPKHKNVVDALFLAFETEIDSILLGRLPPSLVPIRDLLKSRLLHGNIDVSQNAASPIVYKLLPGEVLEVSLGTLRWNTETDALTYEIDSQKLSSYISTLKIEQQLAMKFPEVEIDELTSDAPCKKVFIMGLKQLGDVLSGTNPRDILFDFGDLSIRIPNHGFSNGNTVETIGHNIDLVISIDTLKGDPDFQSGHGNDSEKFSMGYGSGVRLETKRSDQVITGMLASLQVVIEMTVGDAPDPQMCGIYRVDGDQYEYQGGDLTRGGTYVRSSVSVPGDFVIMQYVKMFKDVPTDHWAEHDISVMTARHVVKGDQNGLFHPSSNVTRAEFATLLQRSLGIPEAPEASGKFVDLAQDAWYLGAVGAASKAGIVSGYADSSFRPNQPISREEMVTMISRTALRIGSLEPIPVADIGGVLASFEDGISISHWAKSSVAQAVAMGIVKGKTPENFGPNDYSQRAEAVVMLKRLLVALGRL